MSRSYPNLLTLFGPTTVHLTLTDRQAKYKFKISASTLALAFSDLKVNYLMGCREYRTVCTGPKYRSVPLYDVLKYENRYT